MRIFSTIGLIFSLAINYSQAQPTPAIENKPPLEVSISTSENIKAAFIKATKKTPCYFLTPDDVKSLHRAEIELIIVCKAIYSAGYIPKLELVDSANYARSLYMVETGEVHMAAETIWQGEVNKETMLYSNVVFTKEFLEKGIYLLDSHPIFNKNSDTINLANYSAITVNSWIKDIEILQKLTPKLYPTYKSLSVYTMLKLQRADFTLLPFPSNNDLKITRKEGTFKPIPNIKVQLSGNRQFILSKKREGSQHILNQINLGLDNLQQTGELSQLFIASKLINEKVKNWKVIN